MDGSDASQKNCAPEPVEYRPDAALLLTANTAAQVSAEQWLAVQVSPCPQMIPQPPQFIPSLPVSTQVPPQSVFAPHASASPLTGASLDVDDLLLHAATKTAAMIHVRIGASLSRTLTRRGPDLLRARAA